MLEGRKEELVKDSSDNESHASAEDVDKRDG